MSKILPEYIKNHLALGDLSSSLDLLRFIDEQGSVTQSEAAKAVGLALGTCNLHFQKLEHMGLIHRTDSFQSKKRGRSTIIWELEQDKNLCLLMVFDPPFFEGSLVDFSGKVILQKQQNIARIKNSPTLLTEVENFVNAAIVQTQRINATIRHAFVGTPGLFEAESGVIKKVFNFPALDGIDFPRWVKKHYDLPCFCGSIGLPLYYGEAHEMPKNTRNMVILWDLGIGAIAGVGPLIISQASETLIAEIGHIRIQSKGRLCHCGKNGCLEAYTGGWAMLDILNDPAIKTLEEFKNAVLSGHLKAVKTACDAARIIGKNLCWSLQVMQTERLIVSGPLSSIFPVVRSAFIEGLAAVFDGNEIEALNPAASNDPQHALQTGAYLCARRFFFHPER